MGTDHRLARRLQAARADPWHGQRDHADRRSPRDVERVMMDALLVFAVTIAFMVFAIGYTGRMAMLERRGQLAHRGSVRRRRPG